MKFAHLIGAVLVVAAVYFAIAVEAIFGGRTLLPHAPAVVLILAAWGLPASPAIVVAAAVGFGCDAISQHLFGPAIIGAVIATAIGANLRGRWQLETPLAAVMFGIPLAAVLIAAPEVGRELSQGHFLAPRQLQLPVARAMSSAMAAVTGMLVARAIVSTKRLANALVTR